MGDRVGENAVGTQAGLEWQIEGSVRIMLGSECFSK